MHSIVAKIMANFSLAVEVVLSLQELQVQEDTERYVDK